MRDYQTVFKALSDKSRVRILKILEDGEMCVCQIIRVLGLSQATVSKHLAVLKHAGLLEDRREGTWIFYRLASERYNEYAQVILALMKGWLCNDKIVMRDKKKVKQVKKISLQKLCGTS